VIDNIRFKFTCYSEAALITINVSRLCASPLRNSSSSRPQDILLPRTLRGSLTFTPRDGHCIRVVGINSVIETLACRTSLAAALSGDVVNACLSHELLKDRGIGLYMIYLHYSAALEL
jgi:hypothetical protein